MIQRPPKWQELITSDLFSPTTVVNMQPIVRKAQKEYTYWDKFRHYIFPPNITPEQAWAHLKVFARGKQEVTPVRIDENRFFSYNLTNSLYQKLNYIDTNGAGLIKSLTDRPSEMQASKYIISSLTEEAIASSQIEGASTTHRVAKEMILAERKPRNRDEQMILNNYRAMQKIEEWKDLELTEDILCELQKILTDQTLDNPDDSGRFRIDEDDIVVHDRLTGEVVYTPPNEQIMREEVKKFLHYANHDNEEEFTHPVIKAAILHFWLAYLHPFADGNGRSARAVFYWYLLKRNYWLIQYISVSRAIKQSRKAYDDSYIYCEYDEGDLTYFIVYIANAFEKAISQFLEYFNRKVEESKELQRVAHSRPQFNVRQISLLKHFMHHCDSVTEVMIHQKKHGISRATANNDLRLLVQKGYITEARQGKRLVYMPNIAKIKSLREFN